MATLNNIRSAEQIRKDRWTALAIIAVVAILIGMVVYATITGEPATAPVDDWFLMP